MGDAYGGGILLSMFAKHGISYQSCPKSASEVYLHALPAWTSGMVSMLDRPRSIDQLANLRRKIGSGGQESVVHLGNTNDDLANAISGLIYRLTPIQPVAYSWGGIGVVTAPRAGFPGSMNAEDGAYAASRGGSWFAPRGNGSLVW